MPPASSAAIGPSRPSSSSPPSPERPTPCSPSRGTRRRGERDAAGRLLRALRARYLRAARAVGPRGAEGRALLAAVTAELDELAELAAGLRLLRDLTPRTSDFVVSRGERLSARIVAAALGAGGVRARYVDATAIIRTDAHFGHASPGLRADRSCRTPRRSVRCSRAGWCRSCPASSARRPTGDVTTLGRGGSDLTATLLARALGASRVSLWKDVPGFLTADPRVVSDARVIPEIHTREAAELAYYGAKVLHPRALIPLAGRKIPVFVRPFADPASPGSEVSERVAVARLPVKALSAAPHQALVTVAGNGMLGVPGIAARTFAALQARHISVSLISQASSEHSICFSVPEAAARDARTALEREFREEIARREIDGVEVRPGVATVAVVGLGMAGTPGVAAGVFSALASGGINVVAIAQGSSELNISVVVDGDRAAEAQRRIHAAFQLARIGGGSVARAERLDVVLLGFGQIGRMLAELLARLKRPRLSLRVVGIIDRSGYVFDPRGLGPRRLDELARGKAAGASLAGLPGGHAAHAGRGHRVHLAARAPAPDPGGPHRRRDRAAARAGARLGHGSRALEQAAAGRAPRRERAAARAGPRVRAAGAARDHGGRGPAGDRHLLQAHRVGRPGREDRGLRSRERSASCSTR